MSKKVIIVQESIGRLIVGEEGEVTDTQIEVKAPTVVEVTMQNPQQRGIRLVPIVYPELVDDVSEVSIKLPKASAVEIDATLTEQVVNLYKGTIEKYREAMKQRDEQIVEETAEVELVD